MAVPFGKFAFRYFLYTMFAKTKPNNFNAQHKLQIMSKEHSLGNHGFESASGLLRKNGSQLRQTKLCLNKITNTLQYDGFVGEESAKPKSKQNFESTDNKMLKKTCCAGATIKNRAIEGAASANASSITPLPKPRCNLINLIGRVDFCLKMHKLHSQLNIIWNIYGKLVRIIEGENNKKTLLLRNDNRGPVLQSIYYDFDGALKTLENNCYLHVIGRFVGVNRLQTFKIEQVSTEIWQQNFEHLENFTSHLLMQHSSI